MIGTDASEGRQRPIVIEGEPDDKARWDAEQNLTARKKSDEEFRANFERLKAERLARENRS
jgi:hypothetical protein